MDASACTRELLRARTHLHESPAVRLARYRFFRVVGGCFCILRTPRRGWRRLRPAQQSAAVAREAGVDAVQQASDSARLLSGGGARAATVGVGGRLANTEAEKVIMHLQRREQLATHLLYHNKTNKSLRWDLGALPLGAIGFDVGENITKAIA
jgi:hypothetical protein